jgi:hypothetical protein
MLAEDAHLKPVYESASIKLAPERFERNFARLLKLYADDLAKEATDDLQNAAVRLVRSRRKPIALAIRRKFFQNNEEQNSELDRYNLAQTVDHLVQLNEYLAGCQRNNMLEGEAIADKPSDNHRDMEETGSDSDSYFSVDSDREGDDPALPNLENVRVFMFTGSPLSNLHDRFRLFVSPRKRQELDIDAASALAVNAVTRGIYEHRLDPNEKPIQGHIALDEKQPAQTIHTDELDQADKPIDRGVCYNERNSLSNQITALSDPDDDVNSWQSLRMLERLVWIM